MQGNQQAPVMQQLRELHEVVEGLGREVADAHKRLNAHDADLYETAATTGHAMADLCAPMPLVTLDVLEARLQPIRDGIAALAEVSVRKPRRPRRRTVAATATDTTITPTKRDRKPRARR